VTKLPKKPGIYAIFVDHPASLPQFGSILAKRDNPNLIYVGQASKNLRTRVWKQDCHHRGPGSFFRSVGVILGYVSPCGGKNFKFADEDKSAVIGWIKQHLSVGWTTAIEKAAIDHEEKELIQQSCPLLNLKHNPKCLLCLRALRARSQRGSSKEDAP
jgi:hypothetical protein